MAEFQKATFAGGCFWCLEPAFAATQRVEQLSVGYTGGHTENPTYAEVCCGTTGHFEAIQVVFDPDKISYQELVDIFWRQIDPTDAGGQFADRGSSYQTAIFYHDETQQQIAEQSKSNLDAQGIYPAKIVTKILPAQVFYPAESYHQGYYLTEPEHYTFYKQASGRQPYIEKMWGSQHK